MIAIKKPIKEKQTAIHPHNESEAINEVTSHAMICNVM